MGRRRRKQQRAQRAPRNKKGSRLKKLVIWGVLSVVLLVILAIPVSYYLATSYLSGDKFRAIIEKQLAKTTLVEQVALSPLDWTGTSVGTQEIKANGGELVRDYKIGKFSAVFDRPALFNQHLRIKDLDIDSVTINLVKEWEPEDKKGPATGGTAKPPVKPATPTPQVQPSPKTESWLQRRFTPTKYTLDEATIRSFNFKYVDKQEVRDDIYSVSDVRVTMTHEAGNDEYKLRLENGKVNLPYNVVSVGTLQSALVRYRQNRVIVSDCRLIPNDGGHIDGDGEWEKENNRWFANLVVRNVECTNLMSPDWKKKIGGTLEGPIYLKGENGELTEVTGSVEIHNGLLTALPVLDTMAAFTQTAKFRRINFNVAKATYTYANGVWRITDIVLASDGLLRIEGWIEIGEDESLSGRLQVGVMPGVMNNIPGAEEKIFLPSNNANKMGLLWANVNLSGNLDSPREDLTARLVAAAGDRLFDIIPDSGQKVLKFTTDVATRILGNGARNNEDGKGSEQPGQEPKKDEQIDRVFDAIDRAAELIPGL